MEYPNTPEIDKLQAIDAHDRTLIGEFLEWLDDEYTIAEYRGRGDHFNLFPTSDGIEHIMGKFFKIDMREVAREKDKVYRWVQSQKID